MKYSLQNVEHEIKELKQLEKLTPKFSLKQCKNDSCLQSCLRQTEALNSSSPGKPLFCILMPNAEY